MWNKIGKKLEMTQTKKYSLLIKIQNMEDYISRGEGWNKTEGWAAKVLENY